MAVGAVDGAEGSCSVAVLATFFLFPCRRIPESLTWSVGNPLFAAGKGFMPKGTVKCLPGIETYNNVCCFFSSFGTAVTIITIFFKKKS